MSLCQQEPVNLSEQFISTLESFKEFEIFDAMHPDELIRFQRQIAISVNMLHSVALDYQEHTFDTKYSLCSLNILQIGLKISVGLLNANEVTSLSYALTVTGLFTNHYI